MAKLRKLKLVRYESSLNVWTCTYWSSKSGKNILKLGYVKAPEDLRENGFIKAQKAKQIPHGRDIEQSEIANYQLFEFVKEA